VQLASGIIAVCLACNGGTGAGRAFLMRLSHWHRCIAFGTMLATKGLKQHRLLTNLRYIAVKAALYQTGFAPALRVPNKRVPTGNVVSSE